MDRTIKCFFAAIVLLCSFGCAPRTTLGTLSRRDGEKMVQGAFDNALKQYSVLADSMLSVRPNRIPYSFKKDGSLADVPSMSWTSGFFAGSLWYIYEYTRDSEIKDAAERFTAILEKEQYNTRTHDIGFMVYCSYGNEYRLEPSDKVKSILINAANSLCSRFDSKVGCIRSWDSEVRAGWKYPVIIDNMMNLELLMWAFETTGDSLYYRVATTHADTTMKNHFRSDNSSYHVVSYDVATGAVTFQGTHQGLSDDSSWARGQGWGLYGFTNMYRSAHSARYLDQAVKIADYITSHPNTPDDKIPYWDFSAPAGSLRDASAAAVTASGLLELSRFVSPDKAQRYIRYAEQQLLSLSKAPYTAEEGTNHRFILKHSVASLPTDKEVDVPLNYADYYYLEALLRYKHYVLNK